MCIGCSTQAVSGVNFFSSFTTDIWTTNVSNKSLLSLTAHWITETFEQKAVMLHVQRIDT